MIATAPAPKIGTSRSARYRRVMESLQIRDKRGRTIPLKFRQSQEIIWRAVAPRLDTREKLWFICLKSRQVYASTFFQALTFVRTIEQPGTHSMVIAQDLNTSHELLDMAKRFYDHLPLPKLRPSKMGQIDFPFADGNSRYRVISAGIAAKGRGMQNTCMHASEVAFWPQPEIMEGIAQAIADLPDTIYVLESTANGLGGQGKMFYEEWNRAVRGESDLVPIFIPWFTIPEYRREPAIPVDDWDEEEKLLADTFGGPDGLEVQPEKESTINLEACGRQFAWRRKTIATRCRGSVDIFHQEYPSTPEEAFVSTGQAAFDALTLRSMRVDVKPPITRYGIDDEKLVEQPKGEVRVWVEPQGGHQYVIGADTAEGYKGGDYAAAEILDMATLEQVASIHGTIQPYDFAVLLNLVGRYYNNALLNIEVYPQGHAVQDHLLRRFTYPNLHRWHGKPDRIRSAPARIYGWETNVWSRPLLIEAGQRAINQRLVVIHEDGLLTELTHFTKSDTGKYEAEVGHDDRVLALLLALRSRQENYTPRQHTPAMSDETDFRGVRIVEGGSFAHTADEQGRMSSQASTRRRISRLLRESTDRAVRSARDAANRWMTM